MENFLKIFDNSSKSSYLPSPEYKFDDNFRWSLLVQRETDESDSLGIYLHCESDEKNFPIFVNANLLIVNQKDKREQNNESNSKKLKH